jgi:hypothetical protein
MSLDAWVEPSHCRAYLKDKLSFISQGSTCRPSDRSHMKVGFVGCRWSVLLESGARCYDTACSGLRIQMKLSLC